MRLTWTGWSGFRAECAGRILLIDAHHGGLSAEPPHPPPDWGVGADALVASHGHYDHCALLPLLARRNPGVPVISTDPVIHFARERWGLDTARTFAGSWEGEGIRVDLRRGRHIERSKPRELALATRWTLARPQSMMVLRKQDEETPSGAPIAAVRVASEEGTLLHACEVIHRRTDLVQAAGWLDDGLLDVLLVGVEPRHEKAVVRGIEALRPRAVIVFTPHQRTRDHFDGRRAERPDLAGVAAAARELPGVTRAVVAELDVPVFIPGRDRDAA